MYSSVKEQYGNICALYSMGTHTHISVGICVIYVCTCTHMYTYTCICVRHIGVYVVLYILVCVSYIHMCQYGDICCDYAHIYTIWEHMSLSIHMYSHAQVLVREYILIWDVY